MTLAARTPRLPRINVPDHVENDQAYIAAAQARIAANALRGREKRWLASSPNAQKCKDFLLEVGEFAGRWVDEDKFVHHPLVKASYGVFHAKMRESLNEWGSLTPGQEKAVLDMIERAAKRIEERKEKFAAEAARSVHVGTVGERRDFELTIKFVVSFDTQFGTTHVNGCTDPDGNTIIYKGSNVLGEKGEVVRVKATIKDHAVREGVKQTLISRPKELSPKN